MDLPVPKIKTIREQVYESIRSMIITGQLPQGSHLQENDLAELFGVSRTPVREALKLLREDGLLESGGKGLVVKVLTAEYVKDIFQVRTLLECFALEQAIPRLGQTEERYLVSLRAKLEAFRTYEDMEEYIALDIELHNAIVDFSGNLFLKELIERLYSVLQSVRLLSLSTRDRYEASIDEHIGMIDGMLTRNISAAVAVMRHHLDEAMENVLYLLKKQSACDKKETP